MTEKQVKFRNKKSFRGGMTITPNPDYPFKYGSAWFRTEELRDEYRRVQLLRKSAKRMGWPSDTVEELNRFEKWRNEQKELLRLRKEREKQEVEERQRLREEYGLNKSSTLYNFQAVMSKQGHVSQATKLVAKQSQAKLTPEDKVDLIRKMIEDKTPIMDFMIRTSQLVGAKL